MKINFSPGISHNILNAGSKALMKNFRQKSETWFSSKGEKISSKVVQKIVRKNCETNFFSLHNLPQNTPLET